MWQTVERLEARVKGLEGDVDALTSDKAAAVDEKRRLWAALKEVAAAAGPAALASLTDATGGLVARVRAQGVSLDELAAANGDDEKAKEVGTSLSTTPTSPSTTTPSLTALAARVTTLESEKAELEEALLAASAAAGTDHGAVERAAAATEAAQALAAENARLAARLRALHERAPAVAAAGEMLESLRDENAGLRADNRRLTAALDAASTRGKAATALAELREEVKRTTATNAKLAADLRAAKRALAAAGSAAGTPTAADADDDMPAFDAALMATAGPGAATAALLAAELKNVRAEVARLKAGPSDDAEPGTPASTTTPRSPSLRFLLPRPRPPRSELTKLHDRVARLVDDNARLLQENARLAARAGAAADRAVERNRRDARDGRLTDALSSLVRDLTDENATLTQHVRALAADRAVEAAFASEDGASSRKVLSQADVDALAARRGDLAARAAGVLASAGAVGKKGVSESGGGVVDIVAVCAP